MKLPPRQYAVFQGVIRAHTNKRIAQDLGCKEMTVKRYMTRILEKTGCDTRAELIVGYYTHKFFVESDVLRHERLIDCGILRI